MRKVLAVGLTAALAAAVPAWPQSPSTMQPMPASATATPMAAPPEAKPIPVSEDAPAGSSGPVLGSLGSGASAIGSGALALIGVVGLVVIVAVVSAAD